MNNTLLHPREFDFPVPGKETTSVFAVGVIFIFLLFNPFLALFCLSLISLFFRVPKPVFVISATLAFTCFFFFRDYGMTWADGASSDDIPTYILLYYTNQGIPFGEVFSKFLSSPGNYEPLWHAPFWVWLNVFNGGEKSFIFINYLLIFTFLFCALAAISSRYFILLALAYFFLTPGSIDSIFHIWRQQLSFGVFLWGCAQYLIKSKKTGLFLIFITPLIHLVCIYFVIIFIVYNFLRKRQLIKKKLPFFLYALLLSFISCTAFMAGLNYLASLNLDRVLIYFEGTGDSNVRQFIVMSIFLGLVSFTHIFFKNDDFNKLIIFITFVVTIMTIAFPSANTIFNRLSYFSVPFLGLYFVRWTLLNFSKKWLLHLTFFIFITGLYRIIPLVTRKIASVQFLAFEHPLDPLMGVLKMLLLF
jgi:hypothetical protein